MADVMPSGQVAEELQFDCIDELAPGDGGELNPQAIYQPCQIKKSSG